MPVEIERLFKMLNEWMEAAAVALRVLVEGIRRLMEGLVSVDEDVFTQLALACRGGVDRSLSRGPRVFVERIRARGVWAGRPTMRRRAWAWLPRKM